MGNWNVSSLLPTEEDFWYGPLAKRTSGNAAVSWEKLLVIRVVASIEPLAELIPALLDEIADLHPLIAKDFEESYPQLSLEGGEWEDFCDQKCGGELLDELLECLEDNPPNGWSFGMIGDTFVFLKEGG
jgi:hypothetical protein